MQDAQHSQTGVQRRTPREALVLAWLSAAPGGLVAAFYGLGSDDWVALIAAAVAIVVQASLAIALQRRQTWARVLLLAEYGLLAAFFALFLLTAFIPSHDHGQAIASTLLPITIPLEVLAVWGIVSLCSAAAREWVR